MTSFDYRLNTLYVIKECSSCEALYTTDYCCSNVGLVDKIIRERLPQNCATCGDPVDGLYCRPCAFWKRISKKRTKIEAKRTKPSTERKEREAKRNRRVHVPNVLPTHPTLHLDSDFTISSDSLGSDLVVSFPSGTRNKIFDPGIFIGVQSKIFLSRDAFSISFMRDSLSLVFNTLLLFSSENEDKVFNP
ncbi:hypothetical protein Tco_1332262, partial [Tanacetum coccineum]